MEVHNIMALIRISDTIIDGIVTGRSYLEKEKSTTPGYYDLVRQGKSLPDLPYLKKEFDSHGTVIYAHLPRREKYTYPRSVQQSLGGLHVADYAAPLALADSKAKESFYGNSSAYDSQVAVTMGEMGETVALIRDTATRIAGAFIKLKRFDIPGAFNALGISKLVSPGHSKALIKSSRNSKRSTVGRDDFAANAWLELTYGWKPLLSDIDAAAHDLALGWENQEEDLRIHGSGRAEITSHLVNTSQLPSGSYITNLDQSFCRVGYTGHFKVVDPTWRTLSSIGLLNPLEVAWELLPYSFVADWFAPIGNWVSSIDALAGLEYLGGSKSTKIVLSHNGASVPGAVIGGYIWPDACYYDAHYAKFTRQVMTSPPGTDFLRFSLGEAISASHAASAAALLQTAFMRR